MTQSASDPGHTEARVDALTAAPGTPPEQRPWLLLLDGAGDAETNMARDTWLLDRVSAGKLGPALRVYSWDRPAVSVGRFQDVHRTVNVERCAALGVPVVRRPTGGRGVLHGGDVTVSICAPITVLGASGRSVVASHELLLGGLVGAFERLGVWARVCRRREPATSGDCFSVCGEADLVDDEGNKLAGSAQCRRNGAVLQQISVPHRDCGIGSQTVFIGRPPRPVFPLRECAPEDVVDAIVRGYRAVLGTLGEPSAVVARQEAPCQPTVCCPSVDMALRL